MMKNTALALCAALILGNLAGCVPPAAEHGPDDGHDHGPASADTPAPNELAPVVVGNYQVELWPPEEGLFSQEEVDVEFGVFDTTAEDPNIGGMLGVDFDAKAVVTMPSMPGMPDQKPAIHREGRAGVQGLELNFPHGGDYRISLSIAPKGGIPFEAAFDVKVGDDRPEKSATAPYELKLVDWDESTLPGRPAQLKFQVMDTKTGKPLTQFDIVHEKRLHLLLASKDFSRFLHEHPEMASDGTWTFDGTFPAGGDWRVYADVAPEGKGSQMLASRITLAGDPPTGTPMYVKGLGPASQGGVTGKIELAKPIEPATMSAIAVRLTDTATGKPVDNLEPYLGADGHLMIFSTDGQTVVHSHPDEKKAAGVAQGVVGFTARFPHPGTYIAYAQFKRAGDIKTLGFTIEVNPQ